MEKIEEKNRFNFNDYFDKCCSHYESEYQNRCFLKEVHLIILNHIRSNREHQPTVSDACSVLHMSERTFQRRIKENGKTYLEIKEAIRMKVAKDLLSTNNLTVYRISGILRYKDSSHFTQKFKKYYGIPPREWAKNSQLLNSIG